MSIKSFIQLSEALGAMMTNIMPAGIKSHYDAVALKLSNTFMGSISDIFGQIEAHLNDHGYTLNLSELEYPMAGDGVDSREYSLFTKSTNEIISNVTVSIMFEKLSSGTQNDFRAKQRYDVAIKFIEHPIGHDAGAGEEFSSWALPAGPTFKRTPQ